VCRDTGTLFVVDAVLSLGGCRLDVDGWHVDAAIAGMQKCLGGPPGLALVTCSEHAVTARAQRSTLPHSAYLDLARLQAPWIDRHGLEAAAMSTAMLLAAREALRIVVEEDWTSAGSAIVRRALRCGRASRRWVSSCSGRGPQGADDHVGARARWHGRSGRACAATGGTRDRDHGRVWTAARSVWRIGAMGTNARCRAC